MKKVLLLILLAVAVGSHANAQKGSGFFKPEYQQENIPDQQIATNATNAWTAMFSGNNQGIQTYYKDLAAEGFTYDYMKEKIRVHVSSKIGIKPGETMPNDPDMLTLMQRIVFKVVGPEYWLTHKSGYLLQGQKELGWWDPRTSSLYPNRKKWIIGYLVSQNNQSSTDLFIANCGNPIKDESPTTPPPTAQPQPGLFDEESKPNFLAGGPNAATNSGAPINISIVNTSTQASPAQTAPAAMPMQPMQPTIVEKSASPWGYIAAAAIGGLGGYLLGHNTSVPQVQYVGNYNNPQQPANNGWWPQTQQPVYRVQPSPVVTPGTYTNGWTVGPSAPNGGSYPNNPGANPVTPVSITF